MDPFIMDLKRRQGSNLNLSLQLKVVLNTHKNLILVKRFYWGAGKAKNILLVEL